MINFCHQDAFIITANISYIWTSLHLNVIHTLLNSLFEAEKAGEGGKEKVKHILRRSYFFENIPSLVCIEIKDHFDKSATFLKKILSAGQEQFHIPKTCLSMDFLNKNISSILFEAVSRGYIVLHFSLRLNIFFSNVCLHTCVCLFTIFRSITFKKWCKQT